MIKCLMLGASFSQKRRKQSLPGSCDESETSWTTLDMNPACKPDILFNLDRIESRIPLYNRIPVKANTFDEIHAYQVMEHYGHHGDYKGFFRGMRELWRILSIGGHFIGTTPKYNSPWSFQDPGHTRVVGGGNFVFLEKRTYDESLVGYATSDYREYVDPCWWEIISSDYDEWHYTFALKKVL